jgi:hypothetical protein
VTVISKLHSPATRRASSETAASRPRPDHQRMHVGTRCSDSRRALAARSRATARMPPSAGLARCPRRTRARLTQRPVRRASEAGWSRRRSGRLRSGDRGWANVDCDTADWFGDSRHLRQARTELWKSPSPLCGGRDPPGVEMQIWLSGTVRCPGEVAGTAVCFAGHRLCRDRRGRGTRRRVGDRRGGPRSGPVDGRPGTARSQFAAVAALHNHRAEDCALAGRTPA